MRALERKRSDAPELLRRATATVADPSSCPRSLLLFAHADDETIALGARLSRFGDAVLVHVTDSAPRGGDDARSHELSVVEYREAREAELVQALTLAGVERMRRECWGIADQEAALHLAELVRRALALFRAELSQVVFTHPFEGGHPDHDATAFAAHCAVALLKAAGEPAPVLVEAAFYHAGPAGMETGCFLPRFAGPHRFREDASSEGAGGDAGGGAGSEVVWALSPQERERKRALLRCFRTQAATLGCFGVECERFRLAPAYDFTRPPHAGPVFYDQFPWGMTSAGFCGLAAEALRLPSLSEEPAWR